MTGSKYFLRTATHRGVMVDCGLFQGGHELSQMNWNPLPIQISDVANIVLTHAHLDHTGYLPKIAQWFTGQIWCTPATLDVTQFILRDSAHLQEEDALTANHRHYSRHKPALPLYLPEDAERVLGLFNVQDRHKKKVLPDDISFVYSNAGHILGSCSVLMEKRFDEPAGLGQAGSTAPREISTFFRRYWTRETDLPKSERSSSASRFRGMRIDLRR